MPQILEGYCNMSDKPRDVAEKEAKEFLKIIEDSANYQFGYNHSTGYSMIGYTCGYLRYYYPREFITAYLNNANNEDDINMGTSLAEQFGIKIHSIKFRYSRGKYSCDKTGIYKGIESIKFLSKQIADELYELGKNSYSSFLDLLIDINKTSVDTRQLNILICLDFFSEFGEPNTLLEQVKVFNELYGKKTAKKIDGKVYLGAYSIPLDEFVANFSHIDSYKETDKQIKGFDSFEIVKYICSTIEYPPTTIIDKIKYEHEYLGYIISFDPNFDKKIYFVSKLDIKKKIVYIELYEIFSSKKRELKMWTGSYNKNPFNENDFLNIYRVSKKNKTKRTDKVNPNTGKAIYAPIDGEYEYWLDVYTIEREMM